MLKEFKLSKNSKKNLSGVRFELKLLVDRVLKKSIHDFGIPRYGGLRTAKEQNYLYYLVPQVTWLDGYERLSYHQTGNAFDIFVYDQHGACWKCKWKYKEISNLVKLEFQLMQKEGYFKGEILKWGGDWKHLDLPHFEVRIERGH